MISAGLAALYAALASAGCWLVAWWIRRGARRSGSPLLQADAENWLVNGAISSCVVVAFGSILLLEGTRLDFLVPYVDPSVVVAVVLFSLSVPARMAWKSLLELLNRAPPVETTHRVREVLEGVLEALPVEELFVRVIQPGRTRVVLAHAVLPRDHHVGTLRRLDEIRDEAQRRFRVEHPATILDLLFTADRIWGAPVAVPDEAGPSPDAPRGGVASR
jgi:predicted Co/Zn/Cd cation transporter (cation efflux family)